MIDINQIERQLAELVTDLANPFGTDAQRLVRKQQARSDLDGLINIAAQAERIKKEMAL